MQKHLVVFVIVFIARVSPRSISITQIGGVKVYNDGDFLHCGTLQCQGKDLTCIISKKTDENDTALIIEWSRCVDSKGAIVAEDKQSVINPSPNKNVNYYISSGSQSYKNVDDAKDMINEIYKALNDTISELGGLDMKTWLA